MPKIAYFHCYLQGLADLPCDEFEEHMRAYQCHAVFDGVKARANLRFKEIFDAFFDLFIGAVPELFGGPDHCAVSKIDQLKPKADGKPGERMILLLLRR